MSLHIITGTTGSGKTYFASNMMKKIYDKKNRLIITNVNLKIPHDDYIKPLDVEDLYNFAKAEYDLFHHYKTKLKEYNDKKQAEEDSELILLKDDKEEKESEDKEEEDKKFNKDDVSKYSTNYDDYLKASGLLKKYGGAYIVWDEAQNDLEDMDKVWIRFFSYHRHYNSMDIVLITQDVMLIHRKYRTFAHRFYFGQNASKRLISTVLRYKVYTDAREFDKFFIEKISLPMKKEIHSFYDSGEKNVDKSAFAKIMLMPIALIIIIFIGYNFFTKTKAPVVETNQDNNITKEIDYEEDENEYEYEDSQKLMFFNCNLKTCTLKNNSFTVPFQKMALFAESVNMEILFSSEINQNYSLIVVSVNVALYDNLMSFSLNEKGEKYEKDNMGIISTPSFK